MRTSARLASYLRPYLPRVVWALLAMLAVSAFNGLSVLLLKPIVDRVLIGRDLDMLRLAVVAVPLLAALKAVMSYVQSYLVGWVGQNAVQQIREDLFRRLLSLPPESRAGGRGADVLSRVSSDLTIVQSALTTLPVYLVRDTLTLLFLTGALFRLDWRFALIAGLGLPLPLAAGYALSGKMRSSSRVAQAAVDRLQRRFQEGLLGAGREEAVVAGFRDENAAFFQPMMRYLRATALAAPLAEVGASFVVAAVLFFGGREVILGRMTPGAFFAFLGGLISAYAPAKNLARLNAELQRAWASAERLFELEEAARPEAARRAGEETACPS